MSFVAIAHRGFSSQAPENTLAAFDLALSSGFDNIELDVQLASDKVPVIIHDARVDRTTDGTGEVSGFSLADLRKLDAGSWFNSNYRDEGIPTLDEVLKRYAGKVHLHLELKSNDPALPGIVAQVLEDNDWLKYAATKPFAVPGLTITSAHVEQLERSVALLPNVSHHWLSWEISGEIIARAKHLGLEGVCIAARYADAQLIAKAKDKGLIIRGLEVKGDEDIKVLFEAGVEGATTNWRDRVQTLLNGQVPVYTIQLQQYQITSEPDYKAVGKTVDDELRKHFMGRTIVARGIGSSEHPGKTIDELVEVIKHIGTDRYDPERAGDRYENIQGKHIDLFGFRRKVGPRMQLFKDVAYGFSRSALGIHGKAVRIDILIIYDATKLKAVVHQYEGRPDRKRDGFVFREPSHKACAILGIIKIL